MKPIKTVVLYRNTIWDGTEYFDPCPEYSSTEGICADITERLFPAVAGADRIQLSVSRAKFKGGWKVVKASKWGYVRIKQRSFYLLSYTHAWLRKHGIDSDKPFWVKITKAEQEKADD